MRIFQKMFLAAFLCAACGTWAAHILESGEGLYYSENSNTYGKGNLWINGHGRAFWWDNTSEATGYPLKIFPAAGADYGILPFWDAGISTDVLSYGFQIPGNIGLRSKVTLPNNKKLRMFGTGLSVAFLENFLKKYPSFGYHSSRVGFYPEGIMYSGASMEFKWLGDVEIIRWKSFLPLKFYLNLGYRMPLDRSSSDFDQILLSSGIEYKGLETDFFVDFQAEILKGSALNGPLIVDFPPHRFAHYFPENPLYIMPGIRIKYPNGLILTGGIPIKLSREVGYELAKQVPQFAKDQLSITDGFSPFYADWKVVGKMSFPLRFKIPSSEMVREFLLMKNREERQSIDIDEELGRGGKEGGQSDEDKKRLEEIQKRREEMMQENLLK